MHFPFIAFGTPRRLPKFEDLSGRVAVLDIAFAAGIGGASFEKVTKPFIVGLGDRLAIWIDHHDHDFHSKYACDKRFVLSTKSTHPACPEMVTQERIEMAGRVDTICCHTDFDGLCSAAKWIRNGEQPYPGADRDARIIDTRVGRPSECAYTIDRALRARPGDHSLRGLVVRYLATGIQDATLFKDIEHMADELRPREREAQRLAQQYEVYNDVAVVRMDKIERPYDKTSLLLLGQQKASIAVVCDPTTVTIAAHFNSGVNLLKLLNLQGGMPTVVSMPRKHMAKILKKLHWNPDGES